MIKKGIVLAGGLGTRMSPLTKAVNKQLLPIYDKPLIFYPLSILMLAGIKDILIIVNKDQHLQFNKILPEGKNLGIKITYALQKYPKGLPEAFIIGEKFIGKNNIALILGDNFFYGQNLTKKLKDCSKLTSGAKVFLHPVSNPSQYGVIKLSKGNKILKIVEKPKNPPTNLAVIGIYFFQPKIFEIIKKLKPSWRNELEITDALQMLLESNEKISHNTITNYWKDTGTVEDILDANKTILKILDSKFQKEIGMNSAIFIDKDIILKNNSKIISPSIIGENCNLSNVVLGPNVSIGKNCKISESIIQNSIIMDNCEINGKIKLSNSIISYNTKIKSNERKESSLVIGEDKKIEL
jgi:glucose-1-phosphate thymidylyltransferase